MTDSTSVAAARDVHTKAQGDVHAAAEIHATAMRRLEAVDEEIGNLTRQMEGWDPDDARGMAALVSARDLAAGRAEALHARATVAKRELDAAQEAEGEAAFAFKTAELAAVDARIAELSAALDERALAAHHDVASLVSELRDSLQTALTLDTVLRPTHYATGNPPGPGYWTVTYAPAGLPTRGSAWDATCAVDPLAAAARRVKKLTGGER